MANSEIESYIEAAKSASSRSRYVVLVLVTGSIISFAAAWNSQDAGWINRRLELAQTAYLFCDSSQMISGEDTGLPLIARMILLQQPHINEPNFNDEGRLHKLADYLKRLKNSQQDQMGQARELRRQARQFYDQRFHSCKDLSEAVQELEKVKAENSVLIHVPFFGLSFDINDLGMLSGISFVVVLIWLRVSLDSEFRSVLLTFRRAKNLDNKPNEADPAKSHHRAVAYSLLATYQVFTHVEIPESLAPKAPRSESGAIRAHQQAESGRSSWGRNVMQKFKKLGQSCGTLTQHYGYLLVWLIPVGFLVLDFLTALPVPTASTAWSKIILDSLILLALTAYFLIKRGKRRRMDPSQPVVAATLALSAQGIPTGWQRLSLSLYRLPAIVLLFNLRDDFATREFGKSVGVAITWWVLFMEFVLLVATWLLTLDCMRIAHEIEAEWRRAYKELKEAEGKVETAVASG